MLILNLIFQGESDPAGRAYALEQANSLGFAVFIVGLLFMLLMVIHWYRQKAKVDSKGRVRGKKGKSGGGFDGISQLEFMTKDELKQMILKEKERKEREGLVEPLSGPSTVTEALIVADNIPAITERKSDELLLFDDKFEPGGKESKPVTPPPGEEETEPTEPREKPPPKNPYVDKIERAPLSTELPEDFKKNSRKI